MMLLQAEICNRRFDFGWSICRRLFVHSSRMVILSRSIVGSG